MHGWIYMTLNVFQIMLHFIETFGLGDIAYDIWPVLISFIMETFSSFTTLIFGWFTSNNIAITLICRLYSIKSLVIKKRLKLSKKCIENNILIRYN